MWTFGQPRVGNLAWEQLFQEHVVESWRFTHNRDIVPSLPPRLLGFHHVPREVRRVPAPRFTLSLSSSSGTLHQR